MRRNKIINCIKKTINKRDIFLGNKISRQNFSKKVYSLAIVFFVLLSLFALPDNARAAGASLYMSPASGTYVIGGTFSISVRVNSGGEEINAAEGAISYDSDILQATGVSKGNIFMFWTTEPSISGANIRFGGGNPSPYKGSAGHVLTISFKAKKAGKASVRFTSGAVLANDGKGTNILASMGSASYIISPHVVAPPDKSGETPKDSGQKAEPEYNRPKIKSSSHPDPNLWYAKNKVDFSWDLPQGVSGVSIDFNQKPVSDPGPASDGKFSSKSFENLKGGVWYLHLKFKDSRRWGTTAHFRVMIDLNPPLPFEIKLKEIVVGEWPIINFSTSDEESGLEKYEIIVGSLDQKSSEVGPEEKSFEITNILAGDHKAMVKAIDKAGNERIEIIKFSIAGIPTPTIDDYPKEVRPGDKFYLSGLALPNSRIVVYLERNGRVISSSSVASDANGAWSYLHKDDLSDDRYSSWVVAINKKGIKSGDSRKISFLVSPPVFTVLGSFIINYFTVITSLLFMIVLIILAVFFLFFFVRKKLKKETIEVEEVLNKNLSMFKKELSNEIAALNSGVGERTKKKNSLAGERLKQKLSIVERKINKEIKDVEEILK